MHPLDGPRLKISRAKSEIERLRGAQDIFRIGTKYHVIKGKLNPKTGKNIYRLLIDGPPPAPEWGVYIGEVAHNLRSALDGLIWQLALQKTNTPTSRTQFPIFLVGRGKSRNRRSEFICFERYGRPMISDLLPKHQTTIEGLQPYKRGDGFKWETHSRMSHNRSNPLWWLHEINNADKHRLIHVVSAKIGAGPVAMMWGKDDFSELVMHVNGFTILENGTKICEAPPEMSVDSQILPLIAFDNGCIDVKGLGVIFALDKIAKHVSDIVDSFVTEF